MAAATAQYRVGAIPKRSPDGMTAGLVNRQNVAYRATAVRPYYSTRNFTRGGRTWESRFQWAEWRTLTPQEQVRRCILLAEEAQKLAEDASPVVAERYLQIAEGWLTLAASIERTG